MKNLLSPRRFLAAAAAAILLLAGPAAPSAHAAPTLVTYFNFNDGNLISDPPGTRNTTATVTRLTPTYVAGTTTNVAPEDPNQTTTGNFALHLTPSTTGAKSFQFTVSTIALTNLSLSYAIRGSGFNDATLSYSINGESFVPVSPTTGTTTIQSATNFQIVSYNLPAALDNQTSVTFQLTFTPTNPSAGAFIDLDNIQLRGVPEPATVGAGALAALGLCWHQRRRLAKARELVSFGRKAVA